LTHSDKTEVSQNIIVTVTVTEALVFLPLLEDRGRITESIRIPYPGARKQNQTVMFSDHGDWLINIV